MSRKMNSNQNSGKGSSSPMPPPTPPQVPTPTFVYEDLLDYDTMDNPQNPQWLYTSLVKPKRLLSIETRKRAPKPKATEFLKEFKAKPMPVSPTDSTRSKIRGFNMNPKLHKKLRSSPTDVFWPAFDYLKMTPFSLKGPIAIQRIVAEDSVRYGAGPKRKTKKKKVVDEYDYIMPKVDTGLDSLVRNDYKIIAQRLAQHPFYQKLKKEATAAAIARRLSKVRQRSPSPPPSSSNKSKTPPTSAPKAATRNRKKTPQTSAGVPVAHNSQKAPNTSTKVHSNRISQKTPPATAGVAKYGIRSNPSTPRPREVRIPVGASTSTQLLREMYNDEMQAWELSYNLWKNSHATPRKRSEPTKSIQLIHPPAFNNSSTNSVPFLTKGINHPSKNGDKNRRPKTVAFGATTNLKF